MGKELDRMQIIEALRHGDINHVLRSLPNSVSREDILVFLRDQYRSYQTDIVQEGQAYATEGDIGPPEMMPAEFVPSYDHGSQLLSQDREMIMGGFEKFAGKAMMVGAKEEAPPGGDEGTLTQDEINRRSGQSLDEFDQVMSDAMWTILDNQMIANYKDKMNEIQNEVQHVISLAKQGLVDPEYVLIALAKVNQTKNGVLMTWLGKKAFMANDELGKISRDLVASGGTDFARLEEAREKSRTGTFQMQFLMSDLQKVMGDSASVLENIHSMIGDINRTRREIISQMPTA